MPKLTIDGKEIEVPKGTRVIEAAKQVGVDVPYYCYHPGLSIAGNCRMCLVEIEKTPKLQIACHTECGDGMIVKTDTQKVKDTRKHVLEFLLVNHPLDCPICDQAGECWLQDYYLNYGAYESRLNEDKNKKPKATPIGEHVMLDAERCILCSRCVRFTDEITHTQELGIIKRGSQAEITVFPGKNLDNNYSGNVVDICPVGALTDRDFRFKMRVWYLDSKNSICNGCSRGCNIQIQTRGVNRPHHAGGARVQRLKPRFNEAVNKWWMCDVGRYGYKFHDENRITNPILRENGKVSETHWDHLIPQVAKKLQTVKGKIGVFVSPQLSNEEIFLIQKFFRQEIKRAEIFLVKANPDGIQDDFLLRSDRNPNSKGAEMLGLKYDDKAVEEFFKACGTGQVEGAIVFGQDLFALKGAEILKNLSWSIFIGSNHNVMSEYARVVLPAATYAEKDGTFTNFEGRVQRFERALEPLAEAKPEWKIVIAIARQMGIHLHYDRAEEIFNEMALKEAAFKGMSYKEMGLGGTDIRIMSAPTIPKLEQNSALIFHQEILQQSDKATIQTEENKLTSAHANK